MNTKEKIRVLILFLTLSFFLNIEAQTSLDSISFYYQKGDYKKSISFAEELKKQYLNGKDTLNFNYAYLLSSLGTLNKSIGNNKKSEKYYIQSIAILEKYNEKDELLFATSWNNLALFYKDQGLFEKAKTLFVKTRHVREKYLNKEDTDYIYALLNLAFCEKKLGNYKYAESLYFEGLDLERRVFGTTHYEVANTLNNIGELYFEKGRYPQAQEYFTKSRDIYKISLGENDLTYINVSSNLAECLQKMGKYYACKSIYTEVLEKKKQIYNENDPEFIRSIINLASVNHELGEYKLAEDLYKKAIAIMDKNLKGNNRNYSISINNLALLFQSQNKNKEAEELFFKNIEQSKEIFGEYSQDYATSMDNLASFYQNILNYDKAEELYIKALMLKKSILGESHPDYQITLQNLSSLYLSLRMYEKAEINAIKSKELFEKTFSYDHPEYASVLSNLANINLWKRNYIEAEKLYSQAEKIILKTLGNTHPYYISSLYSLGNVNFDQGKYNIAKGFYSKALELSKNNYHYDSIKMLAIIDDLLGNPNSASDYYNQLFINFRIKTNDSFSYLSYQELKPIIKKYELDRLFSLSFLYRNPIYHPLINIGCYENELLVKNLSLRNQQRISKSIQKSGHTVLQYKYKDFLQKKKQLIKMSELSIDQRPSNYTQLVYDTETIEKELARDSSLFSDSKNALSINWKQVQEKLQPNAIAIHIVAYNYYDKKWTDKIVYAAFVVGKGYKAPKYIPLFEEKELRSLMTRNSKDNDTIQAIKINTQYTDKAISDLFLKPLSEELKNVATIYLSPSGLGNQVDFSALPFSQTQTLGEKYQVHILGSTAEIINHKTTHLDSKTKLELLLYGSIDYNKSEATSIVINDTLKNKSNINFEGLATRSGITKWNYLIGTKKEVEQIQISGQQNGFSTTIINEGKATEETIKQLDGKTTPYLLHLATHGFFFPDPKQELPRENLLSDHKSEIFKTAEDPMMRSGLLFAGANKYWGKPAQNLTSDDGILTASEISNLDLSACQLVVMSACETGLGQINGSEGVFGLQRAFKMAGVKNIIMSLWRVPDAQTAELFDIFYNECLSGKTIHKAFQLAQAKMKVKYPPYYWAGFVLLE